MKIWTREEQEDHRKRRSFSVRMSLFFFSVFVIFAVIIVRTASLQFVEAPKLQEEAKERATQDIPMKPVRGTIYSADKAKLAYSEPTHSLYITFEQDFSKGEGLKNRPKLDAALQETLNVFKEKGDANVTNPTMEEWVDTKQLDVNNKKNFGYSQRLAKTDLSDDEIAYFKENKNKYKGLLTFDVAEETSRRYDADTVAVQTVGYVKRFGSVLDPDYGIDFYRDIAANLSKQEDQGLKYTEHENVGYYGLEQQYQEELRGKNGYRKIGVNMQNTAQGVEEIVPPLKGYDVWSTINKSIQLKTEEAMARQLAKLPKAISASAVAMEIDTGNVVAMANLPDFDPNVYRTGSISTANAEATEYYYLNGAIRSKPTNDTGKKAESVVYLGSTIKPLSVLIGLQEGLFSTTTTYNDTGIVKYGRNDSDSIRNSGSHAYGLLTPSRAIEKSSNTFIIEMIGKRLFDRDGAESLNVWDKHMKEFGLGVETGIDLPDEWPGKADYLKDANSSALSRMVFASFGQKGKYTTMQLAQYTAMLANRGERIEPHLVSKITDSEGEVVCEFKRTVLNKVDFADAYWDVVQKGMATDVSSSFGDFAYKDNFARKTGTSTQGTKPNLFDNGVFIAYAPRDNPKLAVAVMVPEGGFGSESAAPIARAIFDAYDYEYGLDGVPKKSLEQEGENADSEGETQASANGE
ncbi:peptidoglycan D,D-transpeptidase FtsI family protein [Saccharibacillus kuerlensis]|uniref:Penicillin-binding protein 2 n=1 Tax=Saccharibacillus kuerlensis TaxID=459527 RepID=A0ABQ2L495_9BACL|nr:penicillin-binding transpeptidase domain-containing protein [Saccharibacillus kuerlensis]GGO02453.1 penicillin-binding protein 2 [Saccharibacillus kuerlensis]